MRVRDNDKPNRVVFTTVAASARINALKIPMAAPKAHAEGITRVAYRPTKSGGSGFRRAT